MCVCVKGVVHIGKVVVAVYILDVVLTLYMSLISDSLTEPTYSDEVIQ